ncbi:MAG: hypothetical protein ACW981_15450 [Candidatus Hodarchaeales archaeon]|jgi:hypothetical protein
MLKEKNIEKRIAYLNNLKKVYRIKAAGAFLLGFVLAIIGDVFGFVGAILFGLIGLGYMIGFIFVLLYVDFVGFGPT